MGLAIYDNARAKFALKQVNWELDPMSCSIPKANYVPSLTADIDVGALSPTRVTIAVTSRAVNPDGWLLSDVISFPPVPVNQDIGNVVIHRTSDGLLLFCITFPVINVPVSIALTIINDLGSPGLCRL